MKVMAEITLHTGEMGSCFTVNLDFHDHNNRRHEHRLDIKVLNKDKPRTLCPLLNNVKVAEIESDY